MCSSMISWTSSVDENDDNVAVVGMDDGNVTTVGIDDEVVAIGTVVVVVVTVIVVAVEPVVVIAENLRYSSTIHFFISCPKTIDSIF